MLSHRGLHLAVILQDLNALDKLLQFVSKYPALRSSIDDQNNLFQVKQVWHVNMQLGYLPAGGTATVLALINESMKVLNFAHPNFAP